jgi:membrane-bound lytic murein transglycosylase MltF
MAGGWRYRGRKHIDCASVQDLVDFNSTMTESYSAPTGSPRTRSIEDLSGKEIRDACYTNEEDWRTRRRLKLWESPAMIREADLALEPGDIMEMVNVGVYPIALMQSQRQSSGEGIR